MLLPNNSGIAPTTDAPGDEATSALVRALQQHVAPFTMEQKTAGVEFRPANELQGRFNRAVGLLFQIAEGSFAGRRALFFFKKSQVPFSRNRFAYGTVVLPNGTPDLELIEACLDYAASGFHVEQRPEALRRAVTFMVPDREERADV